LDTDSIASAVASGLLIIGTPFTLGGAIEGKLAQIPTTCQ
jgi:hypothetical protein